MIKNIFLATVVISTVGISPTWADFRVGDLLATCTASGDAEGLCNSYMNGLITGVLDNDIARDHGTPICLPSTITTRQAREVVTKYLQSRPDLSNIGVGGVVAAALVTAYPCPK